jgi:hypothetical protein
MSRRLLMVPLAVLRRSSSSGADPRSDGGAKP